MHAVCLQDKELGAGAIQSSHAPWLELVSAFTLKSLSIHSEVMNPRTCTCNKSAMLVVPPTTLRALP